MTGVEILTSAQVATEHVFNWSGFEIVVGAVFAISMLLSLWCYHDTNEATAFVFFGGVGIAFGLIFGCIVGDSCKIPASYETQYKVTISDEVSMIEFYEHYEVIDQEGKIFTVRERTEDAN